MTILAKLEEMEAALSEFMSHGAGIGTILNDLKSVLGIASATATAIAPTTGIGAALGAAEAIVDTVVDAVGSVEASVEPAPVEAAPAE